MLAISERIGGWRIATDREGVHYEGIYGGRYRTRTCDLFRVKEALYQLSQPPARTRRILTTHLRPFKHR